MAPGPYTITASAGPSGIVTRNAGESLPFLATPNAGHAVHQWLVNENMVQTGGNSYTLTNIQADWSVRVTFAPRLSYARQADEIVISWPASDPGYRLEYAVQLPPKAWIQNPVFPSLADGRYWVKEGPTDQIRVYRLKK
ncbi:MAG TPA: hypothetical protein PKE47_13045 [Verrucomicrobiota bacterium]|nr:hypothetical protein [Verrucomicrobiota bacterium]